MKRKLSLVALLGLVIGALVVGCNPPADTNTTPDATNAPPAEPSVPSTNAP